MRRSLSLLMVFGLLGCTSADYSDPGIMPTGYKFLTPEYEFHSPHAANPDDIGYEYSAVQNEDVLQTWRGIAGDLIALVEKETGLAPQDVYLQPTWRESVLSSTYDHVLREELRNRGYNLVSSPKSGLHLVYSAINSNNVNIIDKSYGLNEESYEKKSDMQDLMLEIIALKDGAIIGRAGGVYKVPVYKTDKTPLSSRANSIVGKKHPMTPLTIKEGHSGAPDEYTEPPLSKKDGATAAPEALQKEEIIEETISDL